MRLRRPARAGDPQKESTTAQEVSRDISQEIPAQNPEGDARARPGAQALSTGPPQQPGTEGAVL